MKKIFLSSLLLMVVLVGMNSCGSDSTESAAGASSSSPLPSPSVDCSGASCI